MSNSRDINGIDESQLREWIRKILRESDSSGNLMSENSMYNTFIAPFVDVLKVVKVVAKDITSAAKFNFDVMTTFSGKKAKEASARFQQRKSAIDAEYKTAMESTNAALQGGDAQLIGFMLAPATYLGAKLAETGVDTTVGVKHFLEDSGITVGFAGLNILDSAQRSLDKEQDDIGRKLDRMGKDKETTGPMAIGGAILRDMNKLFFIDHYSVTGEIIAEAEDDKKKDPSPGNVGDKEKSKEDKEKRFKPKIETPKRDPKDVLENIFDDSGVTQKVEASAKEFLEATQEHADEVIDMVENRFNLINSLGVATSFEEFSKAIADAKAAGVDIGGTGLDAVEQQAEGDVANILSDPKQREEFVKAFLKKEGKPEDDPAKDEITDEQLAPQAKNVIFVNLKQGFQEQLSAATDTMKEEAYESIVEDIDLEDLEPFKSEPGVSELLSIIDQAKSRLGELNIEKLSA